jgi:hypothetical protein
MNIVLIVVFTGLVFLGSARAEDVPKLPEDIKSYLERVMLCEHFRGEEPYDDERAAYINDQLTKMRCEDVVSKDIWALEEKYGCADDNQRTFVCAAESPKNPGP